MTNKTSLHISQIEGAYGDPVGGTKNWIGWVDIEDSSVLQEQRDKLLEIAILQA